MRSKLILLPLALLGIAVIFALAIASGNSPNAAFVRPADDESPPAGIRQTCPTGTLFGQEPTDPTGSWSFYTSDTGPTDGPYLVYDNFSGAAGVNAIRFWGIRAYQPGTGWVSCTEDPMPFEIIFYNDAAGQPGAAIATYNMVLSGTATGIFYAGAFELIEWETALVPAPPIGPGQYWVSIQGSGDPTCWFLWANSPDGDLSSYQWDGISMNQLGDDEAFCLMGGADCSWQPGDPHKMHYPQLPDTVGWDVNATEPVVLAEDWQCSETGYIEDFHFWGSWKDDSIGQILYFVLSIHDNIPEGGQYGQCFADGDVDGNGIGLTVADLVALIQYLFQGGPAPIPWYSADLNGDCVIDSRDAVVYQNYFIYGLPAFDPYGGYPVPTCCDSILHSRPGNTLWEREIADFDVVPHDPPTLEGWYDPSTGEVLPDNHQSYFQYNICLPEADWFWQYQDSIYWFNISAVVAEPAITQWGWKSSYHHFMDDAVWAYWGQLQWEEMFEPSEPLQNWFWVRVDPQGFLDTNMSGGSDPYGEGWYFYPNTEWWNIWFYDHPFTYEREKVIHVMFDVMPDDPSQPWEFTFAINWSTDIWSLEGQPPGDSMPPLPGYEPESLYIGRDVYMTGEPSLVHYEFDWRLRDYNPEWVSIDIQGYNFIIEQGTGVIWHDCRQSLDLSFVVTGGEPPPPTGACCYDDPLGLLCVETTQDSCLNVYFGNYQGDGTVCQGVEACCIPGGGCIDADALCCVNVLGGIPQGPGTQCTAPEACCLPSGNCIMADPLCCVSIFNGVPQGAGTVCTGNQACCMNNVCTMMDSLCCIALGGIPQGSGTTCTQPVACCLPTGDCIEVDPLCCDELGGTPGPAGSTCGPVEACCFEDGSCDTLDPLCCEVIGGVAQGPGTICLGDFDPQNGIDDACEEECDCLPGDADGNGIRNVSDAVYLITYIFGGGPPPTPYQVCSGDADCNCIVNVSDAVWMITYIFGGGPPPCSCEDWLANCGPPLY